MIRTTFVFSQTSGLPLDQVRSWRLWLVHGSLADPNSYSRCRADRLMRAKFHGWARSQLNHSSTHNSVVQLRRISGLTNQSWSNLARRNPRSQSRSQTSPATSLLSHGHVAPHWDRRFDFESRNTTPRRGGRTSTKGRCTEKAKAAIGCAATGNDVAVGKGCPLCCCRISCCCCWLCYIQVLGGARGANGGRGPCTQGLNARTRTLDSSGHGEGRCAPPTALAIRGRAPPPPALRVLLRALDGASCTTPE